MMQCRQNMWAVSALVILSCWLGTASAGAAPARANAEQQRETLPTASARHETMQPAFPGEEWETREPEQVGLDAERLEAFARSVGGTGVVVRNGYLIKSWGDASERGDWASASKPVMSTLLFFAVQEDRLSSVDDLVRPWVQKRWSGKDLIEKDRTMTFRHLADMTSGYARVELPGTHWAYNDYAIKLYGETLSEVYGHKSLNDVAVECLAALHLQDGGLFGSRGGLGLDASARDFARIGWFWLNRGKWHDRQILDREFFDDHLAPDVPKDLPRTNTAGSDYLNIGSHGGRGIQNRGGGSDQSELGPNVYGFNWWFNTELPAENGRLLMPDLPPDAFQANGHWGQEVMLIVPSWKLVVAARGDWGGMALEKAKALAEAVVPEDGSLRDCVLDRDPPLGPFPKWSRIEIEFRGPVSQGRGDPNPFSIPLDVTFTGPGGEPCRVPGFFDGDGNGGLDGDVWKVRFSADTAGEWTFQASSSCEALDGESGRFLVTDIPNDAQGFWHWGRLESIGAPQNHIRYLKFRDGPYWLKAGCDDPENFLGQSKNFDTLDKRKAAIDYLAARGINSMYILAHNIAGDNNDVWPWLGGSPEEAMKHADQDARFDVAKLEQWRELFEHMQNQGVVPYLVLEDDSAWHNYDHARYYRELVARFGYLPALVFNIGEEQNENYRLDEALDLAQRLREIDPYDHPRGMHNVNLPDDRYVDASQVSVTAIQTGSPDAAAPDPLMHNQMAIDWIEKCKVRNRRVLMVGFDEGRPEEDRRAWWSAYLGGGVWEAHVRSPYDRPMSTSDKTWTQLGGARAFMESLPFWDMEPHNGLVVEGRAFCLAQPGVAYALYLPQGGAVIVALTPNTAYEASWWNPDNGQNAEPRNVTRVVGGKQRFESPGPGDWALRIVAQERDCSISQSTGLSVQNGWYVYDGRAVWGYCQHNGWWRPGQRPNLARNAPGEIKPNRTEDLNKLTDAMLRFGYPAFEHNFGLWYDRRRDAHDTHRRSDANVVPPFLEQPWQRSGTGSAWDGRTKYDLTQYNEWYFKRLEQFADLCDRKGTILLHCCYMQHALLEQQAHYADFPWRPVNCLQDTGMPDQFPAANVFYDVSHPVRRALHQAYIRHCLDTLGGYSNVVFLCSEEYTGPLSFMQFWLDTVAQWERDNSRDVHVALSAPKDVLDAVMEDPERSRVISTIDLRWWWYEADGQLFAPAGGREVAGRYAGEVDRTTPTQFHRQVSEYRVKHPTQALIHGLPGTRQHAWAALMGGASLLVGQLPYPELADPAEYISPELCTAIQPTYDFIRERLTNALPGMSPQDELVEGDQETWCLAHPNRTYLIYSITATQFELDLSSATGAFKVSWFNPRTGILSPEGTVEGGRKREFRMPSEGDWALLVER